MALSHERLFGGPTLPRQEVTPTVVNPTPKKPTVDEIVEVARNVPLDLTPNHSVKTPMGTWHRDGSLAIFDASDFQTDIDTAPHVKDINEYVSRMVEAEIGIRSPVPVERRPFKGIFSLFPTILG